MEPVQPSIVLGTGYPHLDVRQAHPLHREMQFPTEELAAMIMRQSGLAEKPHRKRLYRCLDGQGHLCSLLFGSPVATGLGTHDSEPP